MKRWLIGVKQLQQHLEGKVIIFDCRFSLTDPGEGLSAYRQAHIPGAVHLDMEKDLSGPRGLHGGRHPLPDPEAFTNRMRVSGVTRDSLVIAYDDNRLAGAARLWWLLRYFGHSQVRILDGGIKAWLAAGLPVSTTIPKTAVPGDFLAIENAAMTATYPEIKQSDRDNASVLIDAREAPRYRGEEEPIDPVAGHIPGAINVPWQQFVDVDGNMLPTEQQRLVWQKLALSPSPVVYCGSGVTACVDLLSLAMIGVESAKLYPGSWSDWCSYPDSIIETSPHS
ncbi:sulfurtransferase [uncultured Porticoccus sp.]|uniref:sulfurtransferase n=1 Tax=uncultured Porticoccus sp. TaxID=1256050 RepID=UPI0026070284|nr:sulfurtransferase [uncultured Porticoccus sp.]